jgi:hypothetical protein
MLMKVVDDVAEAGAELTVTVGAALGVEPAAEVDPGELHAATSTMSPAGAAARAQMTPRLVRPYLFRSTRPMSSIPSPKSALLAEIVAGPGQ